MDVGMQLVRHTDWLSGPVSDLTSGLVILTLLFKLPFAAYHWAFRHPLGESPVVHGAMTAARVVAPAVA